MRSDCQGDKQSHKKKELVEKASSSYSRGYLDENMFVVEICQFFGWTFQEYYEQPTFFIELIKEKYRIDGKKREMASKR